MFGLPKDPRELERSGIACIVVYGTIALFQQFERIASLNQLTKHAILGPVVYEAGHGSSQYVLFFNSILCNTSGTPHFDYGKYIQSSLLILAESSTIFAIGNGEDKCIQSRYMQKLEELPNRFNRDYISTTVQRVFLKSVAPLEILNTSPGFSAFLQQEEREREVLSKDCVTAKNSIFNQFWKEYQEIFNNVLWLGRVETYYSKITRQPYLQSPRIMNLSIPIHSDLNKFPAIDNQVSSAKTIAVGDMHANAIKFIYFLRVSGIIELDNNQYERLKFAYQYGYLSEFYNCLNGCSLGPQANKNQEIIFIGDLLCDRGLSDFLILAIFSWLHDKKVKYRIVISNHDLGFLRHYLCRYDPVVWPDDSFKFDIQQGRLTDELRGKKDLFVESAYLPYLRLFVERVSGGSVINYSHAPFNEHDFVKLLAMMRSSSAISDDMNQQINDGNVRALNKIFYKGIQNYVGMANDSRNALYQFVWNRNIDHSVPSGFVNVFGHCNPAAKVAANQINLNGDLGMNIQRNVLGVNILQNTRGELKLHLLYE